MILKHLKMNKHYEHIPYLIHRVTGDPLKKFTQTELVAMRSLFEKVEEAFREIQPSKRSNFLNYGYTIHKMCRIIGCQRFLMFLPLLKSENKLKELDRMWYKICKIIGMPFHSSFSKK